MARLPMCCSVGCCGCPVCVTPSPPLPFNSPLQTPNRHQLQVDFEPFKPINTSLYLCDNKFHTEALAELLEADNRWGGSLCVWVSGVCV